MTTDVLDAKRYRCEYRGKNIYIIVSLQEGRPWEIFAEAPSDGDRQYMFTRSGMDALARFISRALQTSPLIETIYQLRRSSLQARDLPGLIASILEEWLDD